LIGDGLAGTAITAVPTCSAYRSRGLKRPRSASVIARGHACVQNLRRGHYELAIDVPAHLRIAAAFTELAAAV
jgi:hypothetical protein